MFPVYTHGQIRLSKATKSIQSVNPNTKQELEGSFPVSPWSDLEVALEGATAAYQIAKTWPGSRFAEFLEAYASRIEAMTDELARIAHEETGLAVQPRLRDVEIPRTLNQLRLAAKAARTESWREPIIDTKNHIRSQLGSIGPVAVFGPNNFPFAYNGLAGGDFASAIATGNPVIAKAHPSQLHTTRKLCQEAVFAADETKMPHGFIQLVFHMENEVGRAFVSDPRLAAVAYTGGRSSGLALKAAADAVGTPFFAELSSVNPVFMLPGVMEERGDALVDEYVSSVLMATGQFCTNPGIVVLKASSFTERFISKVGEKFEASPVGTLLNEGTETHLKSGIQTLVSAGATVVVGNKEVDSERFCYANTLLRVSGETFLKNSQALQTEAFGNSGLIVVVKSDDEFEQVAQSFTGNLTGSIYSSQSSADDASYARLEPILRNKVGRLLNDKMPTGVAVSPAMNHGGPYPATGQPYFTAVGMPTSLKRFSMLQCYDNVRQDRLPPALQDQNPNGELWRLIDGNWTTAAVQS